MITRFFVILGKVDDGDHQYCRCVRHGFKTIQNSIMVWPTGYKLTRAEIVEESKRWSEDKANRFSEDDIVSVQKLFDLAIIEKTLVGSTLNQSFTFSHN